MSTIYNLSISAKATYNLHSLNNEGGEGNQIQTRMVNLWSHSERMVQVNAISGDMFKHIQSEHAFLLARDAGFKLCQGCQKFDANRINADRSFFERTKGYKNSQTIDALLETCALDDLQGVLITEGNRSVSRSSVIEFGWVTGIPDEVRTDQFFHVKYNPEARSKQAVQEQKEAEKAKNPAPESTDSQKTDGNKRPETDGSNTGQAIFHRPASSGNYAVITNLEAARIGYNDISQTYILDEAERTSRFRLLLQSLLYTFIQPNGAMRGTQLPHLMALSGALSYSRGVLPAPSISPLNPDYREQLARVAGSLNRLPAQMLPAEAGQGQLLEIKTFDTLGEFTEIMTRLSTEAVPYTLKSRG